MTRRTGTVLGKNVRFIKMYNPFFNNTSELETQVDILNTDRDFMKRDLDKHEKKIKEISDSINKQIKFLKEEFIPLKRAVLLHADDNERHIYQAPPPVPRRVDPSMFVAPGGGAAAGGGRQRRITKKRTKSRKKSNAASKRYSRRKKNRSR